MPKLSWKERRNLYEKIRMDDQERKEWEGLEIRVTPESKRRIECFEDNLAFIEKEIGEKSKAEDEMIFRPHQGIYHQREINQSIKKLNKKAEKKKICVKCGEWISAKLIKTNNKLAYCPYCWEVCFGKSDENWLPGGKRIEHKRGFHKA